MKPLLASLALCLAIAGTAFGQMPAGLPSSASAKAAADQAQARANADKGAADEAGKKAAANTTAAKNATEASAKAAGAKGKAEGTAATTEAAGKANAAGASLKTLVDLNTAPEADLAALPGVGPDNAKKIVDARPFARKDQLVSKKILTKDTYSKIKNLVVAKKAAKQ